MSTIESFCDRAIWLDRGYIRVSGPAKSVVQRYIQVTRGVVEPPPIERRSPQPDINIVENLPGNTLSGYTTLDKTGSLYAPDNLNLQQGSVTTWVKFKPEFLARQPIPYLDCVFFHTDDSRYVLYLRLDADDSGQITGQSIVARAGGNRRILDPYFGSGIFPEVSANLALYPGQVGTPISAGDYHLVSMSWEGQPEGKLCMYLDGELVGEHAYDDRYNDKRSQARSIAIGMRPPNWAGEIIEEEDGTVFDSRPASSMSIEEGGVELRDTRLYPRALSDPEMLALYHVGLNSV
jgi:hypothetical protein